MAVGGGVKSIFFSLFALFSRFFEQKVTQNVTFFEKLKFLSYNSDVLHVFNVTKSFLMD